MAGTKTTTPGPVNHSAVKVHFCIPEHLAHFAPKRRRAPLQVPPDFPLPRQGEVIYLGTSSAWAVQLVVHDWRGPDELHIQIWLDHISSAQHARPSGFALTQ